MTTIRIYLFLALAFSLQFLYAQQDSSNLELYRLNAKDIAAGRNDTLIQQVLSATRNAIPLSQSPFETYIITQEEIQRFACNTLGDVLRLIPGIRSSKIGSAMEGELFMANGLRGNTYFQFLINDVPIKPYGVRGMSIGAQFPIKQAERIEIQLGSAAAAYGMLAGGGVINIILKESERPIYTSAELNFGNHDYNNIDVNFGGKIGKGKYIARFNAYGGHTLTKNRPVNSDSSFYVPETYNPSKSYLLYGNGRDWSNVDTPFNALKYNLPHFSSYAGFHLNFRGFCLSYQQMSRREHSGLGLNPSVLRYTDESNYYQDKISNLNLSFQKEGKKYKFRINTGFNSYTLAPNSSSTFYAPSAALFLDTILASNIPADTRKNFQNVRERLSERQRNTIAYNFVVPMYVSYERTIAKVFKIGVAQLTELLAYRTPFSYAINNSRRMSNVPDFSDANYTGINARPASTTFGKIGYQTANTLVLLDGSVGLGDGKDGISIFKNNRIAVNQRFKIRGSSFNLKGNFAQSELPINNFYHHNLFYASTLKRDKNESISNISPISNNQNAVPQQQKEYQITAQKVNQYVNFSLQFQHRKIDNIPLHYNIQKFNYDPNSNVKIPDPDLNYFTSGFDFNKKDYTKINHIKLFLSTNVNFLSYQSSNPGAFHLRYAFTRQWGEEMLEQVRYNYIRQMPKNISQLGLHVRPLTSLSVGMVWNYASEFYASNNITRQRNQNKPSGVSHQFDFNFDYLVNENLSLRLNINNAFNARIYGIDATETLDDLLFNMQPKRYTQLGIVYNLDRKSKNIVQFKPSK